VARISCAQEQPRKYFEYPSKKQGKISHIQKDLKYAETRKEIVLKPKKDLKYLVTTKEIFQKKEFTYFKC
jgi:hypothetical protein